MIVYYAVQEGATLRLYTVTGLEDRWAVRRYLGQRYPVIAWVVSGPRARKADTYRPRKRGRGVLLGERVDWRGPEHALAQVASAYGIAAAVADGFRSSS